MRPPRFMALLDRSMHTTSQLPVRVCMLLLIALVYVARDFGFDIILGAFAAGMVVSLASPSIKEPEVLKHKLEAIGFGFLVPIFFITSGIVFDLDGLTNDPGSIALVPIFLLALLAVRGLPALLYRNDLRPRDQLALAFYSATSLPIIVAITTIAVTDRKMGSDTAAALVAAGMLSVLIFPTVARLLSRATAQAAPPWARRGRSPGGLRPGRRDGVGIRLGCAALLSEQEHEEADDRDRERGERRGGAGRRLVQLLVEQEDAEQHARDRIERRRRRDRELETALQGDLREPEGGAADGRERVHVPVEDDRSRTRRRSGRPWPW